MGLDGSQWVSGKYKTAFLITASTGSKARLPLQLFRIALGTVGHRRLIFEYRALQPSLGLTRASRSSRTGKATISSVVSPPESVSSARPMRKQTLQ